MKKNSRQIYKDSVRKIGIRVNKPLKVAELVREFCEIMVLPQIISEIEEYGNAVKFNEKSSAIVADMINTGFSYYILCKSFVQNNSNYISTDESMNLEVIDEDIWINSDLEQQLEYEGSTLTMVVIDVQNKKVTLE